MFLMMLVFVTSLWKFCRYAHEILMFFMFFATVIFHDDDDDLCRKANF